MQPVGAADERQGRGEQETGKGYRRLHAPQADNARQRPGGNLPDGVHLAGHGDNRGAGIRIEPLVDPGNVERPG